jgi:hypothetical protein
MSEPRAERPHMPGYGIDEAGDLLPWTWALERLTTSHDYWLATIRDGRPPHLLPVWAVWHDDALWFSAGGGSRKARNLEAAPLATLATEDPREPVVVEGTVERVDDHDRIVDFATPYEAKYGTTYGLDFFLANACFRLEPRWAFGLVEADFTGTPTRWVF